VSQDTPLPGTIGDERHTLLAFLNHLRAAVIRKAEGLSDEDARRSLVSSGTSLLGLVKHLTAGEVDWFQWAFSGIDAHVDGALVETDERDHVVEDYRAAIAKSNEVVAGCPDLTTRCKRVRAAVASEPLTLRWVLVHMIEETGRHAGHADILREQLDGLVGR
jgi:uncharacterized damage-inducible protein DinB